MKKFFIYAVLLVMLFLNGVVQARSAKTNSQDENAAEAILTIEMEDFKEFQLDDAYPTAAPVVEEDTKGKPSSKKVLPQFDAKHANLSDVVFKDNPKCAANPECCVDRRGIGFIISTLSKCGVSNYVDEPNLNLKAVSGPHKSGANALNVMPYGENVDPTVAPNQI